MHSETEAGLVGAAIISTFLYPLIGLRLRRGREPAPEPALDKATQAPAA
jgi:hypothetical protein